MSPMEPRNYPEAQRLERFRDYLRLLTRVQLGRAWGGWLDPSDLVQQTLLEAYQKRDQFRGSTDQAQGAWLRAILARNVADAIRSQGRQKRDIARERSLEAELEASSARLGAWLAADQSTPSEQAVRHEQAVLLANALARGFPNSNGRPWSCTTGRGAPWPRSADASIEPQRPLPDF